MSAASAHRAVFLDRDGTVIEDRDYLSRPDQVALFPGVPAALRRLRDAGFRLVLVTNQSGVGRGYFTMADVEAVHAHLQSVLGGAGAGFDRIYVAPEAPGQPSRGRKPSPQFLLDARDELGLDLASSYVVGDKLIDVECGRRAGVRRSLLVRTGYGAGVEREAGDALAGVVVVDDLPAAVAEILGDG